MNWINNFVRPKIRGFLTTKREVPDNLWRTCPVTGQMVFHKDLEANQFVFPNSDFHDRMGAQDRLKSIFDDHTYEVVKSPGVALDPLKFRDGRRYTERLKEAKANCEMDDAVLVGEGRLEGQACVAAVQDFRFMAGSLGMAAGEAVIAGMLRAVERKAPFVLFAASGGARMQEGILSLMQMPRTTIAVQRLREARLPYIVVLTNPTSGGVTASYAMLGDVHIAEPGALICFAGPRVIQQTIREQLPEGFQRSEYLVEHGMVDMVVHRHKMRDTLARLCRLLMGGARKQVEDAVAPVKHEAPAALPIAVTPVAAVEDLPATTVNGAEHPIAAAAKTVTAKTVTDMPTVAQRGHEPASDMRDPGSNADATGSKTDNGSASKAKSDKSGSAAASVSTDRSPNANAPKEPKEPKEPTVSKSTLGKMTLGKTIESAKQSVTGTGSKPSADEPSTAKKTTKTEADGNKKSDQADGHAAKS